VPSEAFARDLRVAADVATAWAVLTDVRRLVTWVSIVDDAKELEPFARYTAILLDRLGPFKMRADLDIVVSEVQEPERIRVRASGEDRHVSSRLAVDALLTLSPVDGGTVVHVEGTYEVVGKVATLGGGVIKQKANRILDDFFRQATSELGGR
jgi:carbon monoxide dehydrogenase subunit G